MLTYCAPTSFRRTMSPTCKRIVPVPTEAELLPRADPTTTTNKQVTKDITNTPSTESPRSTLALEKVAELPKCRVKLKRDGYYTLPPLSELDSCTDGEQCSCIVDTFTVGRKEFGEITFSGATDVFGLDLDEIITIRENEVEVYADDYNNKPQVGFELNKPAQITLRVKHPHAIDETDFVSKLKQKTVEMDAVFVKYDSENSAWVFTVEHFTRYGLQEDFFDETAETLKRAKAKEPLSQLADDIDFAKDNLKTKMEMKMDTLEISQEDNHMDDSVDVEEVVSATAMTTMNEDYYEEADDFLSASHQQNKVANVQPFNLQGMKSSILYDDEEGELTALVASKKKKTQLFSNKTIFSDSFSEPRKSQSPFPKMDLSTTIQQPQDPLNASVFQNITLSQEGPSRGKSNSSKVQKKSHLFQTAAVDTTSVLADEDEGVSVVQQPASDANLFIKCQSFKMLPYQQSLVFAKTTLLADAALSHSREFNVRWCNNMNLVHTGDPMAPGKTSTKKVAASVFTGNFVSPSSAFGLGNSNVYLEQIEKNGSAGLKKFFEDFLETSLKNTVFQPGFSTPLESLKISDGVAALADYQAKAYSYSLATGSPDIGEFSMQSSVWDLVSALWGKLDDDTQSLYEVHAARRASFSKWLSSVVDEDVQGEISAEKVRDEGHLAVIFSLLSANKVREACKVARENKEVRLAFLISQVSGEYQLKNYMRSQLCLWEERNVDLFMNAARLKVYVLLSGMMVWKSIKSDTFINLCDGVDWKRALALHLWYHCSQTATINDAYVEYNKAYQGTETYESYAPHPLPPYISQEEESVETKDICYHLISLYCKREHSLEKLLTPNTYTAAPLDYHLSWHLNEVILSLAPLSLPQLKYY